MIKKGFFDSEISVFKFVFIFIAFFVLFSSFFNVKVHAVEKNVSNWSDFKSAILDSETTIINIEKDIYNENASNSVADATVGELTKSLTIRNTSKNANAVIDFGDVEKISAPGLVLSSKINDKKTLRLENIELRGESSKSKIGSKEALIYSDETDGNWKIEFDNFYYGAMNNKRIASVSSGSFIFTGVNKIDNKTDTADKTGAFTSINNNWHKMFEGKEFIVKQGSKLDASISNMLFVGSLTQKNLSDVKVSFESGSKVKIENVNTPIISGAVGAAEGFKFYVGEQNSDKAADAKLYTETKYTDRVGGAVAVEGDNAHYRVSGNSKLDITNRWGPAIVMMSEYGVFDVEDKSEFYATSISDNGYGLGGTVRFRDAGNMTFNIKGNSLLKVLKTDLNVDNEPTDKNRGAAIRFYGGNNRMIVSEASKVYIDNDSNREAIQYTTSKKKKNAFELKDKNSKVEIKSRRSAGINSDAAIDIIGEQGTEFQLSSNDKSNATFVYGEGTNLEFNNMLYYDFRNESPTGSVFGGDGHLKSSNSDLSVWKKNTNLEGDPDRSWTLGNLGLTAKNLENIAPNYTYEVLPSLLGQTFTTTSEIASYFDAKGNKTSDLSRLSGNNAEPIVDELRIPTNADKKIYGHVSIPEGVDGIRSAWTDEVTVYLDVLKKDGKKYRLEGKTVGQTNEQPGISIYGEKARGGLFEIQNKIDGKTTFFEEGDSITATKAIRGSLETDKGHTSDPTKDDRWVQNPVEVVDVTPPNKIKLDKEGITNGVRKLSGTSDQNVTRVFLKNNGEWVKDSQNKLVTAMVENGKWELNLPKNLSKNDKFEIYLKEDVTLDESELNYDLPDTYTKEPNGEWGNLNVSAIDYDKYKGYHDAIGEDRFASSLLTEVSDVTPPTPLIKKIARALTKDEKGNQIPQTVEGKPAKPEEWQGTVTKVNNTLSYRVVVQIPGKVGEEQKKVIYNANVTDKIPEGLSFNKDDVKLWKYKKNDVDELPFRHLENIKEADGTHKYNMGDIDLEKSEATEITNAAIDYEESTRLLTVGIGDKDKTPETEYVGDNEYGVLFPGDKVVIEIPTKVTPDAVKSDIHNKAIVTGNSGIIKTETPLVYEEVTAESNDAVNPGGKIIGELMLISAPETMRFADTNLIDYSKTLGIDKTNIDSPLVVKDTLKNEDWSVTVTLLEDMTFKKNTKEYTLPRSLFVRYKNKDNVLELGQPEIVYTSNLASSESGQEEFNISNSWGKSANEDGIKMKASKIPQTGEYVGTVQWDLANGQ